MPVVPFAQPQPQQAGGLPGPAPDETWSLMAAAQMHTEGRLVQVAESVNENVPPGQAPIRSKKSLDKALESAEGDEDLKRIKKLMLKRGMDVDSIPQLKGLED